jgi:hypothetical protein
MTPTVRGPEGLLDGTWSAKNGERKEEGMEIDPPPAKRKSRQKVKKKKHYN